MRKLFLLTICALPIAAFTQISSATIEKYAKDVNDSVIAWRRHLHQYPELSNRETNTMNYIVSQLRYEKISLYLSVGGIIIIPNIKKINRYKMGLRRIR